MSLDSLAERIVYYKHNIIAFANHCGFVPDAWQAKTLLDFADLSKKKHYISLQACVGPGKSAVMCICALWFMLCLKRPKKAMKNAVVSITWDNLMETFWPELKLWQQNSEILRTQFKWTKTAGFFPVDEGLRENWFLKPTRFAQDANKETLGRTMAGRHSPDILSIIDEAGAIPPEIKESAEQTMTNPDDAGYSRIIMAGNPIDVNGALHRAWKDSRYNTICITADPNDPDRTPRVPKEHVEALIVENGPDNPHIMSRYFGQYPKNPFHALVSEEQCRHSMGIELIEEMYIGSQKRLGVDVGGGGSGDSSEIARRQGLLMLPLISMMDNKRPFSNKIITTKLSYGSEQEFIDATGGWASAIEQNLSEAGYNIHCVKFNQKANDDRGYFNIRTENYVKFAAWIKRGGKMPNDEILLKEMVAHTTSSHPKTGQTILIPKQEIKKIIGHSPNRSDAASLTFTLPEESASEYARQYQQGHASAYDPLTLPY